MDSVLRAPVTAGSGLRFEHHCVGYKDYSILTVDDLYASLCSFVEFICSKIVPLPAVSFLVL